MLAYNSNIFIYLYSYLHNTTGYSSFELLFRHKPYITYSIDNLESNTYTDYIRALNHCIVYTITDRKPFKI